MTAVMAILGADDVTFYVPPAALPPVAEDGQVIDAPRIWALAGDRHTAADIAAAFSGERFATYDALARMVESGRLDRSAPPRARRTRRVRRWPARAASCARAIGQVHSRWRQALLHQDPSDAEVRKTFGPDQAPASGIREDAAISSSRALKRIRDVTPQLSAEHGLSEAEIELASRVDGRWDLLSLIKSASVREAEALLAFAHLAEVGVVELG
jgi:hypothetical protein